jgi:alpha-methylacyl-CoA racemase
MTEALLAGVTVLDLSRLLPGPLASWHLAGLGARVVKIEPPGSGDYAKEVGPGDGHTSHFYRHLNQGKEIMELDLRSEEGRLELLEQVHRADIVLESFRPGVLEHMGLGFDKLRHANRRVCLISITAYGRDGAMADKAGHDINCLALSGWLHELIASQAEPVLPNLQIADVLGGALTSAFLAVSALFAASRTGGGSHVTASMTDAMIAGNVLPLVYARAAVRLPGPGGGSPEWGIALLRPLSD